MTRDAARICKVLNGEACRTLLVEVGGHKTFGYDAGDAYEEDETGNTALYAKRDEQNSFLCSACAGYSCDGDAEEFTASFRDIISVRLRHGAIEKIVAAVIRAAEKRCDVFEQDMAGIADSYDEL